jgi:putative addiction module antidote
MYYSRRYVVRLKVAQVGNSVGLVLPKEALNRLKVAKGDNLYLVETPTGYDLSPYDPEFVEEMELGVETFRKFKNTLKELAK